MNLLVLSDKNYEYQVVNLLKSLDYAKVVPYRIYYYTVGFNSTIERKNLIKVPWPKVSDLPKYDFYKPGICLDVLKKTGGQFVYVDTDIIFSKRFSEFTIKTGLNHPCFVEGPIEYPYTFWKDNVGITKFDERKLMDYYGVQDRTMIYLMACLFTFNVDCEDFLQEWQSICENKYLLKKHSVIFPFTDETAANVLLWKRKASERYERIFVNTHKFSTFKLCEESNDIKKEWIDNNMYEQCEDSSKVYFYHDTKDHEENTKILNYINENS
jgi:hypothetical protein